MESNKSSNFKQIFGVVFMFIILTIVSGLIIDSIGRKSFLFAIGSAYIGFLVIMVYGLYLVKQGNFLKIKTFFIMYLIASILDLIVK